MRSCPDAAGDEGGGQPNMIGYKNDMRGVNDNC